jgi:type IV secretory pathway protease TraF
MSDISQKRENSKGDARGMNPNSQKNLKPFLNGRPKKEVCITSWLKEYADQKITKPIDSKNLTFAQAAALNMWKDAVKGDLQKYNFIVERIEGKVQQQVDITTKGNELKTQSIYNLVSLSEQELITLEQIVTKATPLIGTDQGGDISP